MTKWQLATYYVDVASMIGGCNPSKIWNDKDKKTGKTAWDELEV